MNRRAFLTALFAPLLARFVPKRLTPGEAYFNRNCYLPSLRFHDPELERQYRTGTMDPRYMFYGGPGGNVNP